MQVYNHSKKMCGGRDYYNPAETLPALSVYKSEISGPTLKKKTTDYKDS